MRKSGLTFLLALIVYGLYAGNTCLEATLINSTQCTAGIIDNTNTFNGLLPQCTPSNNFGSSWHYFYTPTNGRITIESNADFNDVLTLFKGDCDGLEQIYCANKDEYGFHGENISLQLNPSTQYYLRISSQQNAFGLFEGEYCIRLSEGFLNEGLPENNNCSNANEIKVDNEDQCSSNVNTNTWLPNKNASIQTLPNQNLKSRSSVWYYFTPQKSDRYLIQSNAWFADVLTLYQGDCNTLNEIATDTDQQLLQTSILNTNTTYLLQISGYYAALQSRLCPEIFRLNNDYANTNCANASTLQINNQFTNGKLNYSVSHKVSSCIPVNGPATWFKFDNIDQTSFYVNIEADFPYNFTLWEEDCSNNVEKYCIAGYNSCEPLHHIENLSPNTTYYLNILQDTTFPIKSTDFSIRLLDASVALNIQPLQAEANVACFTNGTGELALTVSGGEAPYSYIGDEQNAILKTNEIFKTTIIDQRGCAVHHSTLVECPQSETACPTVHNLKASNLTKTAAILTYTSANYLQNYIVKFKELTIDNWSETSTTNTYVSLTQLKPCTFYEAKILNVCDEFYGGYSESIYFKTKGCNSCQPPEELFVLNPTSNSAFLHWDIVPEKSYNISYKAQSETVWSEFHTDFPFAILFNLLPCTSYNWRISTICNDEELSNASLDNEFTTLNCKAATNQLPFAYEVYPNPANKVLHIKILKEENTLNSHHIKILNTNGQLVHSSYKKPNQPLLKISLEELDLPFGLYDIEITNPDLTYHQKIIFQ